MKKNYLIGAAVFALALIPFIGQAIDLPSSERMCTMQYAPVCGINGVTYGNSCMAGDNAIASQGECQVASTTPPIIIPISVPVPHICMVKCIRYNPVCGVNGEEYVCGQTEAKCNGVKIAHVGPCNIDSTKACMFSDNKSRFTCAMMTEKIAFEKYLKENVNVLSSTKASTGTKFQVSSIMWKPERVAVISYTDGQNNLKAEIKIGVTYKKSLISKIKTVYFKIIK